MKPGPLKLITSYFLSYPSASFNLGNRLGSKEDNYFITLSYFYFASFYLSKLILSFYIRIFNNGCLGADPSIALLTSKGSVYDTPMKKSVLNESNNECKGLTSAMSVSTYIPPYLNNISYLKASALNPGFSYLSNIMFASVNSSLSKSSSPHILN